MTEDKGLKQDTEGAEAEGAEATNAEATSAEATGAEAEGAEATGAEATNAEAARKSSVSKIVKRSLLIAGYAILAFLLILVGWLCVDKFILKNPVPSAFGYSWCTVETGSMSGLIEEGDVVIIKKTNDYEMGDSITFIKEGDEKPTTHMIFAITKDEDGNVISYTTRGVANNADDSLPVYPDEILGEVVGTIPHLGLFFTWFKGADDEDVIVPGWLYFAGIILIVAVGVFMYYKFVKEPNEPVELPADGEGNGSKVEAHSDGGDNPDGAGEENPEENPEENDAGEENPEENGAGEENPEENGAGDKNPEENPEENGGTEE